MQTQFEQLTDPQQEVIKEKLPTQKETYSIIYAILSTLFSRYYALVVNGETYQIATLIGSLFTTILSSGKSNVL